MHRQSMTHGVMPKPEIWTAAIAAECPDGYRMHIKSQDEWTAIAAAVNVGIDAHLEGFTRSTFDASTGMCLVHPEELHILVRRLTEVNTEELFPDWNYERENDPATDLASCIMETLGFEWV
jgi:hypothetical protein